MFTGVKVFSATRARDRDELGEVVSRWRRANPGFTIVDKLVVQSSDSEFHCVTVVVFYSDGAARPA